MEGSNIVTLEVPRFYDKQLEFMQSKVRYTAYGGARGGGKSFAARWKATLLCTRYDGIQILLLRRSLPELRENHLIPLQRLLHTNDPDKNKRLAEYKEVTKEFIFRNGARIKLGYCASENDVLQFQGQAYDVIILEEATHFTYFQFQTLTESNRPSGLMSEPFSPRMYFTCNPGGVGHSWVKRLFIDRVYENSEKESDYMFIKSLVYENQWLMENDPNYIRTLENLPEERRNAMLYGNWDVYDGQFFDEFSRDVHVMNPEKLPKRIYLYRAIDYGLDMFACYHIAVETSGNVRVIHEIHESNKISSDAANMMKEITKNLGFDESKIEQTLAPSDLWNRDSNTGKSAADFFYDNGVILTQVSRDRINGWLAVKELMKITTVVDPSTGEITKHSKLHIYSTCKNLIAHIPLAQYDDTKYNDMATEPHIITHALDALRYFCIYWTSTPDKPKKYTRTRIEWTEDMLEDYYNGNEFIKQRMVSLYGEIS